MLSQSSNVGSSMHSKMALRWRFGMRAGLMGLTLVFFAACGGKSTPTDPPTPPTPVAPSITTQPQNQSVLSGQTATFTVTAGGTAPLSYQWKRGTTNVGTNASSYTTPATATTDNNARFSVVITNTAGHIDSNEAILTVTSTVVAPTIKTQPGNRSVAVGQTATFSVEAEGTAPFTYQWKRGTANVGSNAANYTTAATTLTDNGAKFSVVVTNAAGHIDSAEATLTVTASTTGATIVDHTCTNLPAVPTASIDTAKSNLKIAYGHTSHGSQLITGMNALAASSSLYAWNEGGTGGAMKLDDTAMGGDVGYHPAWVNNTRAYLGAPAATGRGTLHPDINVIIWSWCGQASDRTQQTMIDTYLAPMTLLESDYPGIKFVYMTGHLDGTGTNGNLHQRNEQIRAYCRANNKILFDFADIESYDPSGNEFLSRGAGISADGCAYTGGNWADAWLAAHPTDPLATLANACGECAHSERLNCIQKGRAAWWLWARLAGWNGQ